MLNKNIPIHSSDDFSWMKCEGCAFASDFNGKSLNARLFDDACDVGFIVESQKTGRQVFFTLAHELISEAGEEVVGWIFEGSLDSDRSKVIKINIYND